MSKIDLHIHSRYSPDADLSVLKILDICKEKNVHTISITDHNTVQAHKEILENKYNSPVNIIPGIELDCTYKGINFHLLGYFIDFTSADFEDWKKEFIRREMEAVPERIKKLKSMGMMINENVVFDRADGMIPQEELMAEIILENKDNHNHPLLQPYLPGGNRSDMPLINFFWDFFGHGKAAHVSVEYLDIKTAIDMIKSNNGTPVLAHPGANFKENIGLIDEIIGHGIAGLELYSSYHTEAMIRLFKRYAGDRKLLVTCGSDFHGKNKPLIEIGGIDCPADCMLSR